MPKNELRYDPVIEDFRRRLLSNSDDTTIRAKIAAHNDVAFSLEPAANDKKAMQGSFHTLICGWSSTHHWTRQNHLLLHWRAPNTTNVALSARNVRGRSDLLRVSIGIL